VSKNAVVSDGKTDPLRPTLVRRIALGCALVLLMVAFKFLFLQLGSTSSRAGTLKAWVEIKNEKAALSLEKTSFAGVSNEPQSILSVSRSIDAGLLLRAIRNDGEVPVMRRILTPLAHLKMQSSSRVACSHPKSRSA
jgi:hypothetical protein